MNEEEKERIKHLIERCNECKLNACITCDITWSEVQAIEKQQAELETLKKDFEIVDHECSRLEQEDIKKDKIINEMAKELYKRGFDIDICDNCSEYNDDCKYIYDCIKQYFERKEQ